tara:strand:+ start:437 stop:1027 length:591 start_codon:yes stop_codon:yes gene_type:complete
MSVPSLGPTVLLASGRLGRKVGINRSDRPVFIDSEGHICCEHGERAPTIQAWINLERAKDEGDVTNRPSVCDCQNLDGLLTRYDIDEAQWPKLTCPLFKQLGSLGAAEAKFNTRPQRFALTTHEGVELWVQPSGMLVCKHGNSKKTLNKLLQNTNDKAKFRSSRIVKCGCSSLAVPRRVGSVFAAAKSKLAPRLKA